MDLEREKMSDQKSYSYTVWVSFEDEYIYIYAAVYQWCGFKSRRGKNKNLTALKSNSNTVWFNFQTYIICYSAIRQGI
jgi:hypothetical protein